MDIDIKTDTSAYYQHEQWFKIADVMYVKEGDNIKMEIKAVRMVNSYGRVRDVLSTGGYIEINNGGSKELRDYYLK